MFLQQVFPVERIKIGLESEDKDELFEELVDVYASAHAGFADRSAILAAIKQREALMSTGIKKGIAIPHGKTSGIDGLRGVLGISKSGIDYDALDGEPVYLVFLLVSSPDASEQHLRALKKLAMLLENEFFQEEMIGASGPQEAFRILGKYEDALTIGD